MTAPPHSPPIPGAAQGEHSVVVDDWHANMMAEVRAIRQHSAEAVADLRAIRRHMDTHDENEADEAMVELASSVGSRGGTCAIM